jgi:hypothetical protein
MRRLRGSSARLPRRSELFRRILARLGRVLDLARLFDLPDRHPDRMIAAQIVLYVGLGTVIAAELWNDWQVLHP